MPEQMVVLLVAALAGGFGAALRFIVDGAVMARMARRVRGASYPLGVLVVNLSGSLAIGFVAGAFAGAGTVAQVIGVGLLGGYTTFSTASYDTVQLLRRGRWVAGLANGLGQLIAAVLFAVLGYLLGGLLV